MANCNAMKMGSAHRVGHGEHQSGLRDKGDRGKDHKQPHGGHGSPAFRHERAGKGEHQSKLRDKAD